MLASQGDPALFGPLFDFYAPRIYRYALHRLGNIADAKDVTSQVFADALQSLGRYRIRRDGSFGGWLFTIARRRCADHFRASDPVDLPVSIAEDNSAAPLDDVIAQEEQRKLEEILMALDEAELELLRLRFASELTYKQIGDVIGKSEAAAKMSLIRLIQRLRVIWEG